MVKINLKTVKNATFSVEVPVEGKVADIKAEIEKSQGAGFPAAHQVLVFKGAMLDDQKSLSELEIAESSFMVVMVQKPKAAPAAPAPAAEPKPAPAPAPAAEAARDAPANPAAPAAAAATPAAPAAPSAPAAATGPADVYGSAAGLLASGAQLEGAVASIMEMGFPRDQVVRALRAAFNNPDRAVEYLFSGSIPEVEAPPVARAPVPAAAAGGAAAAAAAAAPAAGGAGPNTQPLDIFGGGGGGAAAAAAGGEGGEAGGGALDHLRGDPQFQMLRNMVRANPEALPMIIQTLARSNPQLMQLLQQNQNEFLQLLEEGDEGEEMMGMEEGGEGQVVELTEADMEAIQRLESLGFPRNACIEAYLACDKNEELAANFLLGMD